MHGGLAGVTPEVDEFDLGHGVTLSRTYAHLMAPFLMAFAPAPPGGSHPAPWRAAEGGIGFDIHADLRVPQGLDLPNFFDRPNTVWWLAALIRLRGCWSCRVAVVADRPFARVAATEDEPRLIPLEIDPQHLRTSRTPAAPLDRAALGWVRDHWHAAGLLANRSEDFNVAVQAFDGCTWARSVPLALVSVWGALERLFSPARTELKFRVSANIAAFLEAPGPDRLRLFKLVQKLYDAWSAAAHGAGERAADEFLDTCDLMRRVLLTVIERGRVPSRDEQEAALFGVLSR